MFGIGFLELCIIAVVALVFVGPHRLPDLMRQTGRFFVQLRRMSSEMKSAMDSVIREAEAEIDVEEQERRRQAAENAATLPQSHPPEASEPFSSSSSSAEGKGPAPGDKESGGKPEGKG